MSGPLQVPLGPFVLEAPLGRGGMAEVWRGRHERQGVPVAVKVMTGERARDPRYRASFRHEVQSLAALDHSAIVLLFDHGETGPEAERASEGQLPAGSPFLAMELAEGTLREHLAGLTWLRLCEVLVALLEGLAHAHARGVVHRDIKPSNVLVFTEPHGGVRYALADFGLAYSVGRGAQDERGAVSGTPWYMAPEQVLGDWRDDGPWTDLYALGCLAFELVCGRPLFAETSLTALADAQLHREPPPLHPLLALPRGFEGWLRRLLRKNPRERFQRAADAACALQALGEPAGDAVAAPALDERPTVADLAPLPVAPAARRAYDILFVSSPSPAPLGPRPTPPFPATWRRPAARPHDVLHGAGLGLFGLRQVPFVGREAERDLLWSTLGEVVRARAPHLVLVQGAAGNGKSRLAEWIAERAHEVGAAHYLDATHGRTASPGEGLPRMVEHFLRCQGLMPTEVLARTERLLRAQGVTDESEWQGLARLMTSGRGEGRPPAQSAPERNGLLLRLLQRTSRKRAVIVRLDDVQWGVESIAWAAHVMTAGEGAAVLFLLTVREEALGTRPLAAASLEALLALPRALRIDLPALDEGERRALVGQILGLRGELAEQVADRSGGNPLFAVELVADWVQRGVLELRDDGFVLKPGERAPLPDDLHQVWAEHVDHVLAGRDPSDRLALEVAAALGRTVESSEWEGACDAAGVRPSDELVDALAAGRLARRTAAGWSFGHEMLRESVERRAREAGRLAAHHGACAQALEPRYRAGARRVADRLARHLLFAEQPGRALPPLLRAAAERRETSDYAVAHAWLDRRERTLQALAAPAGDPQWGQGWALRARVCLHEGRVSEAQRWSERTERDAIAHGWTDLLSEALRLSGDAARRQGALSRAAELYDRGVALRARLVSPHGVAASLWGLGDVARQRGRLREALDCFERSRELYARIGDEHGVADHHVGAADVAWQAGHLAEAERRYGQALDLFARLGNRYGTARARNGLGEVARAHGRYVEAEALYRGALELLDLVGSADAVFPRVNLGLVELATGRVAESERRLLPLSKELADREWHGLRTVVDVALLACAAERTHWDAWGGRLARAQGVLAGEGLVEPDIAWAAEVAGDRARSLGETARAREAYQLACAQWTSLGNASEAQRLLERL